MVIKTLDKQNPFADYGNLVEGDRFIGRTLAIKSIHNRVLGDSYGNLAIMGLPRIGKSCLAWNALMKIKNDLVSRKIIVDRIYVSSTKSSEEFFLKLMDVTLRNIHKINPEQFNLLSIERNKFFTVNALDTIEYFFELVKKFQYRMIFILDEFDAVSKFFSLQDFQLLRELSIDPKTKICLVTISRLSIQEIETNDGAVSNFSGVFSDLRLGMYNDSDIQNYWQWVINNGIDASDIYQKKVKHLVGNHPFLIDLFNYFAFNESKSSVGIDNDYLISTIESELKLNLYDSFEYTLNKLKEQNLYTKAFQLVFGPVYDVDTIALLKLEKYQFLLEVDNLEKIELLGRGMGLKTLKGTSFVCFSNYFTQYWKLKMNEIEFWGLWKDTEVSIRDLVKSYLDEIFSTNWEEEYLLKYPSINRQTQIEKLQKERDKYLGSFGTLASTHIVDYSYPRDIYDLFISIDWDWFSIIFTGKDKRNWSKIFDELAFLRNPIAHNNTEFVPVNRINEAKLYCELILEKIAVWRERRN